MRIRDRLFSVAAVAATVAGSLVAVAGSAAVVRAAPAPTVPWCVDAANTYPCVLAATRDGASLHSDPHWSVQVLRYSIAGDPSRYLRLTAQHDGSYDLGAGALSDTWAVRLDMGSAFVPRVATGHAGDVEVSRGNSGHYTITVRGTPVTVTQGCDQSSWPWSCPSVADNQFSGYFDAQITDYAAWTDVASRDAMYGMNYFTNMDATSVPPEVVRDPATGADQLLIRIANSHYLTDGTTVVHGHSELRIPNAFLRVGYGVPNPATMTGASLIGTVSGTQATAGTVSIMQESGADAMLVTLDGVTFSTRTFTVRRGTITPTRPTNLHATRTAAHRGRVAFTAARPRGARITGYRVRCTAVSGQHVRYASGTRSPIVVTGLISGRTYYCVARALSKAGAGRWSSGIRMPRRP